MLAYILAIAVAIGSFSFYMAAFFVPEMHRRQDFFWSGLGLFYAVVLWFCAGRLTGAVLLGQLTSVTLLGGLGWHTLELRRNLTPELVQTPVSWEDLQSLVQGLQLQLQKYIRFDDVTRRLQAAGYQLSLTLANWRDRANSPEAAVSAEVPPLKRSPAYEFETPTGDGQAVPSEFATVASRQLSDPVSPKTASAETTDGVRPSATVPFIADNASADNASENAQSTAVGPAAADQSGVSDQPTDLANEEAAQSPTKPLESLTNQSQQPTPASPSRSPVTPPGPAPAEPVANQSPQPRQKTNPITGALGRLTAVVQGRRQPQPQRSVIEIPPRPPSIARESAAPPAATAVSASSSAKKRSAKSPRAVIEIPPRPPSIPRSPAPATASPAAEQSNRRQRLDNDDADRGDPGEVPPTARFEAMEPIASSENVATPAPPPSPPADINWPDTETNWPLREDDISRRATPQEQTDQPAPSTDDTNWPDDEDTNWPD